MKDNKIIKVAAISFIGLVAVPAVIGATIKLGCIVANGINHLAYKMKIKKGLKEGSIIEIDGQYYEVEVEKNRKQIIALREDLCFSLFVRGNYAYFYERNIF